MNKRKIAFLSAEILIILCLFSCSQSISKIKMGLAPAMPSLSVSEEKAEESKALSTESKTKEAQDQEEEKKAKEKLESSSEQVAVAKSEISEEENILINLFDVTIADFVEAVFGNLLKENYVLSQEVKDMPNKITVSMSKPVERSKVASIAVAVLQQYQIYVEKKDETYYFRKEAAEVTPVFKFGKTPPSLAESLGLICQVIPIDYINLTQIDLLVRRFLSKSGSYFIEPTANSFIIIDYPDRIAKILEIIDLFDREPFEGTLLEIVKPMYWDPVSLVKQLQDFLSIESIPVMKPRQSPRGVFFVPVDRLGEVFIFASQKEWLDRILFYIEKLDKPEALGGEVRPFVYFPKNSSAKGLGQTLSQVLFGAGGPVSPLIQQGQIQTTGAETKETKQPQISQIAISANITVDETRNCLIIKVKPSEWATIKDLIEKLDIPPKQVLIEAIIGELTLDKQFQLGMEWFIKNTDIKIMKKEYIGSGGTEQGLGLGSLGFFYTLVAKDELFRAAINAFLSQNLIKIISAPRVMGIDNQEARIEIGTEVPVITSEAVTGQIQQQGTTGLLRSIQYRSTGVILTVKPIIHSEGMVSLDIKQEVSEAQANIVSEIQSPIILKRSIQTSLMAKDGETIFIGGLISKTISKTKSGIPILSQIPVIGSLFRTDSQSERRTELIVLLTPRIIDKRTELDFISEEFRKKLLPEIKEASIIKKEKK